MNIKLIAKNGRYSIITDRSEESKFNCEIKHISSTFEQPYIAANFIEEGKAVGGRTMTKMEVERTIESAKKAGMIVEGI